MFNPILEFKDNMTTMKHCEKCKSVPLHRLDSEETWNYYIGDHVIPVLAHITKGECPRCGSRWEAEDSKDRRDQAFLEAIDDFWKNHLDALHIGNNEMASVIFVVSRLMLKVGQEKQRQVAAELGKWLAGCAFLH